MLDNVSGAGALDADGHRLWPSLLEEYRAAATGPLPPDSILLYGTSSFLRWHSWSLEDAFPPARFRAIGFPIAPIAKLREWCAALIAPLQPRHLVVYAGHLELREGKQAEEVLDSLIALCRDARAAAPSLSAGILSLISSPDRPRRHRWSLPFNDLARRRLANHPDAILVDAAAAFDALTETERATLFDSDRVHLQKSGYAHLAACIHAAMRPER